MAFELLDRRKDARGLLGLRDVRKLGEGNDNWASVDAFSVYVAGPVWRNGQITDREVLTWARSPDLWWRRTALVATVALNMKSRGGTGDARRTLMICRLLATDAAPMVSKGLSWALRALISVDRPGVEAFLHEHGADVPALVRREVGNKLRTGRRTQVGRTRRHARNEGRQRVSRREDTPAQECDPPGPDFGFCFPSSSIASLPPDTGPRHRYSCPRVFCRSFHRCPSAAYSGRSPCRRILEWPRGLRRTAMSAL